MTGHQAAELHSADPETLAAPGSRQCRLVEFGLFDTKTSAEKAALATNSGRTIGKEPGAVNRDSTPSDAGIARSGRHAVAGPAFACLLLAPLAAAAEDRAKAPLWVPVPTRIDRDADKRQRIAPERPPPDPAELVRVDRPARFLDAVTFIAEGRAYRIAGVRTFDRALLCVTPAGARWACGLRATTKLSGWIGGRVLACRPRAGVAPPAALRVPGFAEAVVPALVDCRLGETGLARRLVDEGWAEPLAADDPDLGPAAAAARRDKRGVWAESPPP